MPWNEDGSMKKAAYTKTSGFKMKGFSPFDKTDFSRGKLKQELSEDPKLVDRWSGMTLSEFDKTLASERKSYISSEPKPTAKEVKTVDERHAKFRLKAQGL